MFFLLAIMKIICNRESGQKSVPILTKTAAADAELFIKKDKLLLLLYCNIKRLL
jgi:hypothetical protein